jgi:tetratricopeptide (TPR) repeat protein
MGRWGLSVVLVVGLLAGGSGASALAREDGSGGAARAPATAGGKLAKRLKAGRAALDARQWTRAERAFLAALTIDSTHPEALAGAAEAALRKGNVEDALPLAERALMAAPTPENYVLFGDVHTRLGQYEAAAESYAKAVVLRPLDPDLARRAEEAETLAREAMKRTVP